MAQKRLYGPAQVSNVAADTYVVPAGRKATVRHIHVFNPTGAAVDLTLSVGNDAAPVRVFDAYPIASKTPFDWYPILPLAAAEKIQAKASVDVVLVIEIAGDEDVA
jgi:hypothetical protein